MLSAYQRRQHGPARDIAELTGRQVRGIDAFACWRRAVEADGGREHALDAASRPVALRRMHEAVVAQADRPVAGPWGDLSRTALLVVSDASFGRAVRRLLEEQGVSVIGVTAIGPEAVGWAVAQQPDLLVIEASLIELDGEDTVRHVRRFCPHATIAARVEHSSAISDMLDAGADASYVRSVSAADLVRELVQTAATQARQGVP